MPTVRTTCPTCSIVIVDAGTMTVRRRPDARYTECTFLCPDCVHEVVQPISDRMVPVLIGAGCRVEPWSEGPLTTVLHPSAGGRITETEIAEFVAELEGDHWFDELRR